MRAVAGVPHSLLPADPHGNMWSDHRRATHRPLHGRRHRWLADAAGSRWARGTARFPCGTRPGRGIGRAYYGEGDGLGRRPRPPPLRRVHGEPSAPARAALECRPRDRRSATSRMGRRATRLRRYAGGRAGRLLLRPAHEDLGHADARVRGVRARHHLAAVVASSGGRPARAARRAARAVRLPLRRAAAARPAARTGGVRGRARDGASRAGAPAGGQGGARGAAAGAGRATSAGDDPFDPILADVREQALAAASHPAWEVLDRDRCETLLSRPAAALDEMSRYQVWRLATLFVE